jgi:hypothetical protein
MSTTFEALLSEWLEDGPTEAPDQVLPIVLASVQEIPQRGGLLRRPWKSGLARRPAGAVVAIAAAVAIMATVLLAAPRTTPSNVGAPSTAPGASPNPASTPIVTTWWDGLSVSGLGASFRIPPGWTDTPADPPWAWQGSPGTALELIAPAIDPERGALFIASQPMPAGVTPANWWADRLGSDTGAGPAECFPMSQSGYRTTTVGGQTAYVHGGLAVCSFTEAIVLTGGRAYQVTGFAYLDHAPGVFDPALFEAFLSTIRFEPASASPGPG